MQRNHRIPTAAVLTLALGVTAAACGGDDDDDAAATAPPAPTAAHASPPTATVPSTSRPAGSTEASAAGVTNACVTACFRTRSANSAPPKTDNGATTIVDDAPTASRSSNTDASKLGEAKCNVRDCGESP